MLKLGWLDASILIAYVLLLAGIGAWAARRSRQTTEDYFLAGRSIPWLVTWASFVATCISAVTFIGTSAEGYSNDYRYLLNTPGDIAATFFIAGVFLPHFQKLKLTSIYEAVALRMGQRVRLACSSYFLLTRTLASTVRIVAIAKVLEVVSLGSLSYAGCVITVMVVILAYTTIGGGRAIAWTDLLQFTLLMGGALVGLGYIITHVPGGVPAIIEAGRHAVRPDGTVYNKFNFLELLKPANLGLLCLMVVWGFSNASAAYGTDQDMVQRLLACNDHKKAQRSLILYGLTAGLITFIFLSIGAGLYAYARVFPDFVAGMRDNDHVFARFIMNVMPSGLRGLMLAAVASAAMGSADSALASLATVFTMDFYKPYWGKGADEARCVRVSRMAYLGFGILFVCLALALRNLDTLLWLAFRVVSFTYGPLLGVFLVTILTDWKVKQGVILTMMIATTLGLFSLDMTAKYMAAHATSGFWVELRQTYWRLYVISGALIIPAGAWLFRETVNMESSRSTILGLPKITP